MKRDYTILVPNMLPMHFRMLIAQVLRNYGYQHGAADAPRGHEIAETGLKYVPQRHLLSRPYWSSASLSTRCRAANTILHKTALMMFQTGGGCRASNYIFASAQGAGKGRATAMCR